MLHCVTGDMTQEGAVEQQLYFCDISSYTFSASAHIAIFPVIFSYLIFHSFI